jgi:hypothetical protein
MQKTAAQACEAKGSGKHGDRKGDASGWGNHDKGWGKHHSSQQMDHGWGKQGKGKYFKGWDQTYKGACRYHRGHHRNYRGADAKGDHVEGNVDFWPEVTEFQKTDAETAMTRSRNSPAEEPVVEIMSQPVAVETSESSTEEEPVAEHSVVDLSDQQMTTRTTTPVIADPPTNDAPIQQPMVVDEVVRDHEPRDPERCDAAVQSMPDTKEVGIMCQPETNVQMLQVAPVRRSLPPIQVYENSSTGDHEEAPAEDGIAS